MGLVGLSQICKQLVAHGKPANTPAALVERGTLPDQRVHVGTLSSLPEIVESQKVRAPTLVIIGDVVGLQSKLNWYQSQ
jgi:uroporphyrin-III C-methyltransferase/precorrin-2 dehydrogenase/sirohydrochlorin ferrochelatase